MTIAVDTHMHVYRTKAEGRRAKSLYDIWEYGSGGAGRFSDWDGDEHDAIAALDRAKVDIAVVTTLLDPPAAGDPAVELVAYNEWIVDLAARHSRFAVCLAVDPRYLPVRDTLEHIRRGASHAGVVGIKIHPPMQQLHLDDERLWPIFAACRELGLRVVSHSGPSLEGVQLGEPNAFRPLLAAFPDLKLVLAHLGGAAWDQTRGLASEYPSVYFDLCEIIEWVGAERAPSADALVQLIRDIGVHRVMMGSDFPWYDVGHTVDLVRTLPGLAMDETAKILGTNAATFFGLTGPTADPFAGRQLGARP